jgi:hypothetical protein
LLFQSKQLLSSWLSKVLVAFLSCLISPEPISQHGAVVLIMASFIGVKTFLHIVYLQLVALNAGGQGVLLESIVCNLLNCLNDPSSLVRQLCLKGLSSVSHLEEEQVSFMVFDGFTNFVRNEGFWYSVV